MKINQGSHPMSLAFENILGVNAKKKTVFFGNGIHILRERCKNKFQKLEVALVIYLYCLYTVTVRIPRNHSPNIRLCYKDF